MGEIDMGNILDRNKFDVVSGIVNQEAATYKLIKIKVKIQKI
jgi:hypothetical protein